MVEPEPNPTPWQVAIETGDVDRVRELIVGPKQRFQAPLKDPVSLRTFVRGFDRVSLCSRAALT